MPILKPTLLLSTALILCHVQAQATSKNNETDFGFQKGFLTRVSKVSKPTIEALSKDFTGIKKGFFLNPEPSQHVTPKVPSVKNSNIVVENENSLALVEKPLVFTNASSFSEEPEEGFVRSIWNYPYLKDGKWFKQLLNHLGNPDDGYIELFYDLIAQNKFHLINPQVDFLSFLNEYINCNKRTKNTIRIGNRDLNTPDFAAFLFQCFNHSVVEKFFTYMKNLSSAEYEEFRKQFISEGSDFDQGEFVIDPMQWKRLGSDNQIPTIRYYRHTTYDQTNIYRLYLFNPENINEFDFYAVSSPGNFLISAYGIGELEYTNEDATTNRSGFILDKENKLIENSGFAFIKDFQTSGYYSFVAYDRHSKLDQMFFFEKKVFSRENVPQEGFLGELLTRAGGISELDRKKFLLIPELNTEESLTLSSADFLLPYLYHIREGITQNSLTYVEVNKGLLEYTIEKLEEVAAQELEKTSSLDEFLEDFHNREKPSQRTNLSQAHKSKYKKKKVRKNNIKAKPSDTKPDPKVLEQRRKEWALKKIQQKYLKETSDRRNFSSSEAQELLAEMKQELSSIGVAQTGSIHVRGSHKGDEIISQETHHSTKLGLARRPQKRGYQAGTVRTIIKDYIAEVFSIIKGN